MTTDRSNLVRRVGCGVKEYTSSKHLEHDFSENEPRSRRVIRRVPIVEPYRVGYDGYHYLIILDEAAGCRKRYTVYRIPATTAHRVKIIGRELPLGLAKKVAQRDSEK